MKEVKNKLLILGLDFGFFKESNEDFSCEIRIGSCAIF